MAYATVNDIVELYGQSALYVADHDRDGAADAGVAERAIVSAEAEIDTYIGARYPLPLTVVPIFLTQLCVDIAVYRLALSADVLTEEHRRRYDDAIKHLMRIADGKAALVFPVDPGAPVDPDAPEISGPRPIVMEGPPRLFTRRAMRDF